MLRWRGPWSALKHISGKGYHMVHYWHVVKNVLKWKLGYTAYLCSMKNGGASVAVAVEGEEKA
jgi:hypothetical protein